MKRFVLGVPLLCLVLALGACAMSGDSEQENTYLLYYPVAQLRTAAGENAIVTRSAVIDGAETMTAEELAEALLNALLDDAPDAAVAAPMPGGTTLLSLAVTGRWAQVDFSRQYARLAGIDLTLADYCVTLTLTQLEGINAVSITSGGRELPYRRIQTLTEADPLLAGQEDALRPVTVSLYFADKENGELRAERQALTLYEGQTRVNALLEALLRGPETPELTAVLDEDFVILSSRVEDGTCYLNLPDGVSIPEGTAGMAIDSLVRSLCSLDYVERVQIVVEGETVPSLCGVDVSEPLLP